MAIKHKVLKDFQLITEDKKILILKAKTLLEDFKYKNKSETVIVPSDVIRNNPDYFAFIDWKEELQSYLKTNKIPQPAVITKKLLPFIESLLEELPSKTKEVIIEKEVTKEIIVEKPITIEKEVIVEKNIVKDDYDMESKLKKVELLQRKLEEEINQANEKETDYIAKNSSLEQKDQSLKKKEESLNKLKSDLDSQEKKIQDLMINFNEKSSKMNLLINKSEVIDLLSSVTTTVPYEYQGWFGNSQQYYTLNEWFKSQIQSVIDKVNSNE